MGFPSVPINRDDLSKAEVLKALAAAEFAAAFTLFLDVMVTLDFGRMGIEEPCEARDELQRFLKAANAWLAERHLPVAWMACIERTRTGNLHAHIAIHVPGMRKDESGLRGVRYRTHFRRWARAAVGRRVGEIVPRTVNVRCSLVPSVISHWLSVTYLLKGFDRSAVIVGSRNGLDGNEKRLGDILPFDYRSPGDVGIGRRLFISGNLGPARRNVGSPPAAEFMLTSKPDISRLQVTPRAGTRMPDKVKSVIHRPFHAAVNDGVFDIRQIYGAQFAGYVTGIKTGTSSTVQNGEANYEPDLQTWLADLEI